MACFLSNISAKYYENPTMLCRVTAKNVGDVSLRHSVCIMSDDNFTYEIHFCTYGIGYLQGTQVKFVYDHRVKVKVTGAKKVADAGSCNNLLRSAICRYSLNGATDHVACGRALD